MCYLEAYASLSRRHRSRFSSQKCGSQNSQHRQKVDDPTFMETGTGRGRKKDGRPAQCDAERERERAERCAKTKEKNLGRAKFSRPPSRSNATPTPNRTKITARNPILPSPLLSLSFFARSLFTSMDWSMEWIGRLIHSRQCQSTHTSKMRSGGERGAQIQTVTE